MKRVILIISGMLLTASAVAIPPPPPPPEPIDSGSVEDTQLANEIAIMEDANYRYFNSNGIPDHDYGPFPNDYNPNEVSAQDHRLRVSKRPKFADATMPLGLYPSAVLLNGVPVDSVAAECWNVEPGQCHDPQQPWRLNPMSEFVNLGTDGHNAHVQPNGTYHYHGDPNTRYDEAGNLPSGIIGYAADGFPLYGPYIKNGQGGMHEVTSSFVLKNGMRPPYPDGPGGAHDGTYLDDYVYLDGQGDLDECNGAAIAGRPYGYYVTAGFPYMMACFKGTPDASFQNTPQAGEGAVHLHDFMHNRW